MTQHTSKKIGECPIHVWTDYVEGSAWEQLHNIASLPFLHPHGIAVMPDVHYGIGATVGSVVATQGAIIPAAVGVDIGCGMNAVKTSLRSSDLPDSLSQLRHNIERGIPLGPGGAHREERWVDTTPGMYLQMQNILPPEISGRNAGGQLGTLGGGNHFIEVCLDESECVWVVLHSGSRGIGNQIGRYFIEKAKKTMEKYFITLPDQDLAYFPDNTKDFTAYWNAVDWAQNYALENRYLMMATVLKALAHDIHPFDILDEGVNCHHNYVAKENHFGKNVYLTRKGAIRARVGDLGIIPGSMGARTYIVEGLGNADSYHSCSHGAGRAMGRKQAARQFTVADLEQQTRGIECRKDEGVLDEIPGAYKDIDEVMAHQSDLVKIKHTLHQVLNIKGN